MLGRLPTHTRLVHRKAAFHEGRLHAQVKSGTIFDNVLVTDDAHYAEAFANATWGVTKDKEVEMFNALAKQKAEEAEAKRKEVRICLPQEQAGRLVDVRAPVHGIATPGASAGEGGRSGIRICHAIACPRTL